jgi:hypothetical protein
MSMAGRYPMSAWRRKAIEFLPGQRTLIEDSESVGMLWVELWFLFCDAHRHPPDEALIRGTYQFALWTLKHSGDGDIQTATCFHFYEHLPEEPLVRKQAPRYMFRSEVLGLSEVLTRRIGPEEFRKFLEEFVS